MRKICSENRDHYNRSVRHDDKANFIPGKVLYLLLENRRSSVSKLGFDRLDGRARARGQVRSHQRPFLTATSSLSPPAFSPTA